jgi:hypothetical protein
MDYEKDVRSKSKFILSEFILSESIFEHIHL